MKSRQTSQASRLGEPPLITESIESIDRIINPDEVAARVADGWKTAGYLIEDEEDATILADVLCEDYPVIAISKGFTDLTGFSMESVQGCNCRMLLHGVPEAAISKSVRKNLRDFCRMCRMKRLEHISEVTSLQPNARSDGSHFVNFFLVGLVKVHGTPYALGIQLPVGEGLFVSLNGRLMEQVAESARDVYKRIKAKLSLASGQSSPSQALSSKYVGAPGFTFYSERLQDHCILLNGGQTAMRREPQELATNCLVYGSHPARKTPEGLFFAIRVEDAIQTFEGLPMMGFTRRKPLDRPDLYPAVCRCMGASVLVGACGEAFARDQWEHFKIGFKPPPQHEVASWSTQPNVLPHKRRPPVSVEAGDVFGCLYTRDGHIQLWKDGALVLDFDIGRPIDEAADYYAVVDVCLSAYFVSLLPVSSPSQTGAFSTGVPPMPVSDGNACGSHARPDQQPSSRVSANNSATLLVAPQQNTANNIDQIISDVVNRTLVKKAMLAAVGQCKFCVTIADPRGKDIPLVAVSEAFETMTGYKRSEILGVNCRFLNQGCPISPTDLMGLRIASESGSAFTALLPNRKKSGEMFVNLLDLRGLTIARDVETNEELWYLIGIQADVSGLSDSQVPEDHLAELQEIASVIRERVKNELVMLAANGAEDLDRQITTSSQTMHESHSGFRLLQEPTWRSGSLSQKEILDLVRRQRLPPKARPHDTCRPRPTSSPLASGRSELHLRGALHFGFLAVSSLAFLAGDRKSVV